MKRLNKVGYSMDKIINKFRLLDARKMGELLPKRKFVDLIITSPPYWNMKDYKCKNQIGFGQTQDEYIQDMKKIFNICYDISKDTASFWLIADTFKRKKSTILLPFQLAELAQNLEREDGKSWILQDIIIWNKSKSLPWSRKGQVRNTFEYILFFTKTEKYKYFIDRLKQPEGLAEWWVKYPERYNPRGRTPDNIWEFIIPTQGSWANNSITHACPFPPILVERIISLTTNSKDVVLDPFAGIGTVLGQAFCMDRQYIGLEVNPKYIKIYQKHLLPSLIKLWRKRESALLDTKQKRRKFEKLIIKLRKLKYPKTLFGIVAQNNNISDFILGFIVKSFQSKYIKHKKLNKNDVEIMVVISKVNLRNILEDKISLASQNPPLSKFGLNPIFKILTIRELKANLSKYIYRGSFRLYERGLFYRRGKRIDSKDIISYIMNSRYLPEKREKKRNNCPPIIADLSLPKGLSSTGLKL